MIIIESVKIIKDIDFTTGEENKGFSQVVLKYKNSKLMYQVLTIEGNIDTTEKIEFAIKHSIEGVLNEIKL